MQHNWHWCGDNSLVLSQSKKDVVSRLYEGQTCIYRKTDDGNNVYEVVKIEPDEDSEVTEVTLMILKIDLTDWLEFDEIKELTNVHNRLHHTDISVNSFAKYKPYLVIDEITTSRTYEYFNKYYKDMIQSVIKVDEAQLMEKAIELGFFIDYAQ